MKLQHKALLVGGLALGLAAAFLYVKNNESQIAAVEAGEADAIGKISPGEAIALGLSILALLRQIVHFGRPED